MNVMAGLTGMPWMAELTEVPEITENDQKKVDKTVLAEKTEMPEMLAALAPSSWTGSGRRFHRTGSGLSSAVAVLVHGLTWAALSDAGFEDSPP